MDEVVVPAYTGEKGEEIEEHTILVMTAHEIKEREVLNVENNTAALRKRVKSGLNGSFDRYR